MFLSDYFWRYFLSSIVQSLISCLVFDDKDWTVLRSHGEHNLLQQSFLAEPKLEGLFQLNEGVSVVLQSVTPRAENVAFMTLK